MLDRLIDILASEMGRTMAKATLLVCLKDLGIAPEAITPTHLEAIAEGVTPSLGIFVGSDKAKVIAAQIRQVKG